MKIDIHSVLTIWGKQWARYKDCKGYPSLQPFMREAPKQSNYYGVMSLDDETCLAIDKQIRNLHDTNLVQYQILMAKYYLRWEDKDVWRELGFSQRKYYNELSCAKSFILGALLAIEVQLYF